MAIGQAIGAAVGLAPSLYKLISGIGQRRRANRINPIDPGFQVNSGIIDNARVLGERAGNYVMPGYSKAVNNLGSATAGAFDAGVQGASSSGDVLDLATKLAYGQQSQLNNLATQNAIGTDQALLQSLDANAAAGEQYQLKNAYEREKYQAQLREKAALLDASNQNTYGAIDTAATIGTTLLNPRKTIDPSGGIGSGMTPAQQSALRRYLEMSRAGQGLGQQNLGITSGMIS